MVFCFVNCWWGIIRVYIDLVKIRKKERKLKEVYWYMGVVEYDGNCNIGVCCVLFKFYVIYFFLICRLNLWVLYLRDILILY